MNLAVKDKAQILAFSVIALILFALLAITGKGQGREQDRRLRAHPGKAEISLPMPPAMQFINQILRPCTNGVTVPFVSAVAAADGDFDITTCAGRAAYINGVQIIAGGGGNVAGPASSTDNAIARFDGLTGKLIQNSLAILSDAGNISTPGSVSTGIGGGSTGALDLSGVTSGTVTITPKAIAGTWTFTLPADDGTPGQFLQTDGAGITSWQTVSAGTPGGVNTQVQFNDGGAFGGDAGLTYNKTTDALTVAGQYFTTATITAGGTTGNQTINNSAGSVNFAAAGTSLVVTSNKVTTNSVVICTVATNDATLKSVSCVAAAGSFTMFANAAATAETRVNFWVLNQ